MLLAAFAAALLVAIVPRCAWSEEFWEPFDAANVTWKLQPSSTGIALQSHRRALAAGRVRGGEELGLVASQDECTLALFHALPATRLTDELRVTLWLKADRPGVTISLHLIAPGVIDPETSAPVEALLPGTHYEGEGQWQELRCKVTDLEVSRLLKLLRAQTRAPLEANQLQVDGVVLSGTLSAGPLSVTADDLRASPILPPLESTTSEPAATAGAERAAPPRREVEFRLDRLQISGRPFFPRLTPHWGEPPEQLVDMGFNVVWIPRYDDADLLKQLRAQRLWAAAVPPHPRQATGDALDANSAGLLPFGIETQPIAFWMMGTRWSSRDAESLRGWITQVQDADRQLRRPLAADVIDDERGFSRHLDLVGCSRHIIGSSASFQDYASWLRERRQLAKPGSFLWTWLQLEPANGTIPGPTYEAAIIEPEQLRLQVYTAIAAGYRGIGFWTTRSLSGGNPLDRETQLAIKQLNLELMLLEPWLATASGVTDAKLTLEVPLAPKAKKKTGTNPFSRPEPARIDPAVAEAAQHAEELSAVMMRTDYGTLLLPIWLGRDAQYCVPLSAASDTSLIVPGAGEATSAYELSATGDIHTLDSKLVAGGRRLKIPRLDQTTAILLTSDRAIVEQLRLRVKQLEPRAARTAIELARLKVERVGRIQARLANARPATAENPRRLGQARLLLERGQQALQSNDYDGARLRSAECLQAVRLLQRQEWETAIESLSSPVASPYAVAYQTLPAHYDLMARYASVRHRSGQQLLPSGAFEDFDSLLGESWQHEQEPQPELQITGELSPRGASDSQYALRLAALPSTGASPALVPTRPPVTLTTPPMTVHAGQLVRISGQVQITQAISGNRDGLMIYDSLGGKPLAMRWVDAQPWTSFELLREVRSSQTMTITVMLSGMGDTQIDNLSVETFEPQQQASAANAVGGSRSDAARASPVRGASSTGNPPRPKSAGTRSRGSPR